MSQVYPKTFPDFSSFGENAPLVAWYYELFLADPRSVDARWASFFESFAHDLTQYQDLTKIIEHKQNGQPNGYVSGQPSTSLSQELLSSLAMVANFRSFGHLKAKTNPLSQGIDLPPNPRELELSPEEAASTVAVNIPNFRTDLSFTLSELSHTLNEIYCGSVGFQFQHIGDSAEREWLLARMEDPARSYRPSTIEAHRLLKQLIEAETFESELHRKFVGHKRFSLEGAETLIPMLGTLLEIAPSHDTKEIILGMAHRGRLNVLTNAVGKPMSEVFSEFEDSSISSVLGSGDVKYHLGYESNYQTRDGQGVNIKLAPNPSHLEFVNPVVEGMARARQDLEYQGSRNAVLPLLIHGDAAFIGQGVVSETLNFSCVPGYTTGGTLHIVINNQVGFTTSPAEAKSSIYCSDMAKLLQAPIFHVNAEDPEAASWVVKFAMDYRQTFGRDVVIDLVCWRKHGHNEGDDPSFTQPLLYAEIRQKKLIWQSYSEKLINLGVISEEEVSAMRETFKQKFERAAQDAATMKIGEACAVHGKIKASDIETAVPLDELHKVANCLITFPSDFTVHPKLKQILEKRVKTLDDGSGLDWGFCEALAFGTLVDDGAMVRLSGQDCERGTFSQRHLVYIDNQDNSKYSPFSLLKKKGSVAGFEVYNSTLSETGVLGFEFGYASVAASWGNALVIWEAQFGDFANGAQVIIDQFISSSEQKWNQLSGVVMLLPHGYEGQGPEHSSARLERFLQLCADGNMFVCVPSSAAQHFHLLRKHALSEVKRPLVVMTPKSLLRSNEASAKAEELSSGRFRPMIAENMGTVKDPDTIVFLCGKVYYDVKAAIQKRKDINLTLVRVERLYPFPKLDFEQITKGRKYRQAIWVQEEPRNMGAAFFMQPILSEQLGMEVKYVGRRESASTATGSGKMHAKEQKEIVDSLLNML